MVDLHRLFRRYSFLAAVFFAPSLFAQTEIVKPAGEQSATELSPHKKDVLRGDIAMAKKDFADAVVAYQKALQVEPRNATLLNKIGIAYHQQMLLGQAKKYYERAIKADATYAYAYNNLGMIHYNRKKWKNAAKDFQRALNLKQEMPATVSNLGHAYLAMKRYDEAFAAFGRALAMDPDVFERRSTSTGAIIQDRSVEDRALYYFFIAKTFALAGNPERCAQYLLKARDEGHKGLLTIDQDPAFASVIKDERIQEFLAQSRILAQAPRP